MRRYLIVLMTSLALAGAGCGDDDDGGSGDASTNPAPDPTSLTQAETTPEPKPQRDRYGCLEVAQPEPKKDGGQKKPTQPLTGDYTVTFKTNCGSFTINMDEEVGGLSAASFVQLAKNGFFNDTFFHRISPGFVIQGGDPLGQGIGGPGYKTKDPPPDGATYPKYTVAMAKTAEEPAGTSGSQFFVMTGDGGLPPEYAIVGKVTEGMKVVDAIGQQGDASERPTAIIKIEKATVSGG